jgi:nitroreductase
MGDFYSLASTRRSIRKYSEQDVQIEEIIKCINTAVTAPSGCNSQCWYFVIIHNKSKLDQIAKCIEDKIRKEFYDLGLNDNLQYIDGKVRGVTFFKDAPVCIAVYLTDMDYYDQKMETAYTNHGITHNDFLHKLGNPDLLSIGAAIQTMLLAFHEKQLGACWMNEPLIAKDEIEDILGKKGLISLIPVGYPLYSPKNKEYKSLSDIIEIIQ